jgi:hypothetical protein
MTFKLLGNDLLIRRVIAPKIGLIHLPPQALDFHNNGMIHVFKLLAKGPGRLTRKGVVVGFEAEPGDNLIVFPITQGPQDVGGGQYILKKPEESVLAVVPLQH